MTLKYREIRKKSISSFFEPTLSTFTFARVAKVNLFNLFQSFPSKDLLVYQFDAAAHLLHQLAFFK